MTIRELFYRGFLSLIHPRKIFSNISPSDTLPYKKIVPFMLVWGIIYAILHFRFVDSYWVWKFPIGCIPNVLTFIMISIVGWQIGAMGLWCLAKIYRRPMTYQTAELAIWFPWLTWALIPIVDILGPLAGYTNQNIVFNWPFHMMFMSHVSWFFAFPILIYQMTALCRELLKIKSWPVCFILGCLSLLIARCVIEPLPYLIKALWPHMGFKTAPAFWWLSFYLASILSIVISVVRWLVVKRGGWIVFLPSGAFLGSVYLGSLFHH